MARPSHYDPAYAHRARILCRLGADNAGLARAFSVSLATLYRWLNAHPPFVAAVATGRAEAEAKLTPTRFERATGYEVTAESRFTRNTGEVVIARYRKRILANPRVALRWLRARCPERWTLGEGTSWSHNAPWQKRATKKNDSQNSENIIEIIIETILDLVSNNELTVDRALPLIDLFYAIRSASAGKDAQHVPSQNTASTDQPSHTPAKMTSADLTITHHQPEFIESPDPVSPPQPGLARRQDQPERPVPHRLRRVPRGRHSRAARVRMIMADHPLPAAPRAPVRREQGRRVYFECPRRVSRHIRGGLRLRDPPVTTV